MEIVLGLGGNVGDRFENLVNALRELIGIAEDARPVFNASERGGQQVTVSPIYESDALLPEGAPDSWNKDFYNLAVRGYTQLTFPQLLDAVKSIEQRLGRGAHEVWSPRTIDIDILAAKPEGFSWGKGINQTIEYQDGLLTVPHPALKGRPFALWPLADIAPHWILGKRGVEDSALKLARGFGHRFTAVRDHGLTQGVERGSLVPCSTARAPREIQEALARCLSDLGVRFDDGSLLGATVVGILNLTPDSFSDGMQGEQLLLDKQISRACELVNHGASVLDLGGESTRPGAKEVEPREEWRRIEPLITALITALRNVFGGCAWAGKGRPQISIDTRHHEVAAWALEAGVDWINDVSGLHCPQMREIVRDTPRRGSVISGVEPGAGNFVFMHSLSVPPSAEEVMSATGRMGDRLVEWAEQRLREMQEDGLRLERAIFDPGIGFGKTPEQSWQIIQQVARLAELPVLTMVGHSRKSFLSRISEGSPAERDLETAVVSSRAAEAGIAFLRVHNVKATVQAIRTTAFSNY